MFVQLTIETQPPQIRQVLQAWPQSFHTLVADTALYKQVSEEGRLRASNPAQAAYQATRQTSTTIMHAQSKNAKSNAKSAVTANNTTKALVISQHGTN